MLTRVEAALAARDAEIARKDNARKDIARKDKEIAGRDHALITLVGRVEELEKALEDAHRRSKRQTAPFSKGDPKTKTKTPGRKLGGEQSRYGHRRVPIGPPDSPSSLG
jgi:hypothetical protein